MRKRITSEPQRETLPANIGWLDLEAVARVEVTSEDAGHPLESAPLTFGATGSRTQEFILRWSPTADASSRDIVRQQYHFSPSGATEEREEYRVELEDVAALELTIIPNLSGGSYASLAQLRLAGSGE